MQLHELKRATKRARSRQVGRGATRGKTSGRGTKGQKARSGHKIRPEIRDVMMRLPKLRGRGTNAFKSIEERASPVNLEALEKHFESGNTVSPSELVKKGVVRMFKGRMPVVKILGNGSVTKKLAISDCEMSASARAKILAVGGTVPEAR